MAEKDQEKTAFTVTPWVLPENSQNSGVITFYHNRRKWGRISQTKDEGSPSIFFHFTAFKPDAALKGKISPREGYLVTFTAVKAEGEDSRLKASDIELAPEAKDDHKSRYEAKEAKRSAEGGGKAEAAPRGGGGGGGGAARASTKEKKPQQEKKPAGEALAAAGDAPKTNLRPKSAGIAKDEKAQNPKGNKGRANTDSAAAGASEGRAKEGPQLTVNATLVSELVKEGAIKDATVSVNLKAGRFLSLLKRKACKKLNLKTTTGLEMFIETEGKYATVKYEDFKKYKDGDSCNIQIRESESTA